jgi:hypothetical protein
LSIKNKLVKRKRFEENKDLLCFYNILRNYSIRRKIFITINNDLYNYYEAYDTDLLLHLYELAIRPGFGCNAYT